MASRRSRSPSTPSEGEIIESGSETKATTSQTPLNGTKIDRPTRARSSSASRSPASPSSRSSARPRRSRSRTRSRSPRRGYRGNKRRRYDDYDDYRYRHEPRRAGYGYDSSYDRRPDYRRSRSYYDYDRENGYGGPLYYGDDYDRSRERRLRTRSRSPFREVRKPRKYSGDDSNSTRDRRSVSRDARRGRPSTEQLVSERGGTPVAARASKQDAETRESQVQEATTEATSRAADRYVPWPLLVQVANLVFFVAWMLR